MPKNRQAKEDSIYLYCQEKKTKPQTYDKYKNEIGKLISSGGKINYIASVDKDAPSNGLTAAHLAIADNDCNLLEALIDLGALLEKKDKFKCSLAQYSALLSHNECLKRLSHKKTFSWTALDADGRNLAHYFILGQNIFKKMSDFTKDEEASRKIECLPYILDNLSKSKFDISSCDESGYNIFHYACKLGYYESALAILNYDKKCSELSANAKNPDPSLKTSAVFLIYEYVLNNPSDARFPDFLALIDKIIDRSPDNEHNLTKALNLVEEVFLSSTDVPSKRLIGCLDHIVKKYIAVAAANTPKRYQCIYEKFGLDKFLLLLSSFEEAEIEKIIDKEFDKAFLRKVIEDCGTEKIGESLQKFQYQKLSAAFLQKIAQEEIKKAEVEQGIDSAESARIIQQSLLAQEVKDAIERGNFEGIRKAVALGYDLNNGMPLHNAVHNKNYKLFDFLLSNYQELKIDIDKVDKSGHSVICLLAIYMLENNHIKNSSEKKSHHEHVVVPMLKIAHRLIDIGADFVGNKGLYFCSSLAMLCEIDISSTEAENLYIKLLNKIDNYEPEIKNEASKYFFSALIENDKSSFLEKILADNSYKQRFDFKSLSSTVFFIVSMIKNPDRVDKMMKLFIDNKDFEINPSDTIPPIILCIEREKNPNIKNAEFAKALKGAELSEALKDAELAKAELPTAFKLLIKYGADLELEYEGKNSLGHACKLKKDWAINLILDVIFESSFCSDKKLRILKSAFPDIENAEIMTKKKVKRFITEKLAKSEDPDQPSGSSSPRGHSKVGRPNLSR